MICYFLKNKMSDIILIFINICQGNGMEVLKLLDINPEFTLSFISTLVSEKIFRECYHRYDTCRFKHIKFFKIYFY